MSEPDLSTRISLDGSNAYEVAMNVAAFTPSQLATITDLTTIQQRDWRRRGILPTSADGHARFDPFITAAILLMKSLAAFDVGPGYSQKICSEFASELVFHALLSGGLETHCAESIPPLAVERIELMALGKLCSVPRCVPASYSVVFADGTYLLADELDPILLQSKRPAVVLPLAGLGQVMSDRAGRAIAVATIKEASN